MYIDLSYRKFILMLAIVIALVIAVYATYVVKDIWYGSTPPFASAGFAMQEVSLRIRYGLERYLWNFQSADAAVLSYTRGATSTSATTSAVAIPVLTYHRIVSGSRDQNNVTESVFRDQMLALKRDGWQTITLQEFQNFLAGKERLPRKSILITFDDGAKESFYPVDPLFQALGYNGVIYIIASEMYTPATTYYLSTVEIKRMLATGRWEIGSHSYDGHRPYPVDTKGDTGIFFADKLWNASLGRLETTQEFTGRVTADLTKAKATLQDTFGIPIDTFAFPLGNETGIAGARNFPQGASITQAVAKNIYSLGFLQTNGEEYTYNYPILHDFIARRIHVDYDWSGQRLIQELDKGLPKSIPYDDTFTTNKGWIQAWGTLSLGTNNLSLKANAGASSASTFLDGTGIWNNYSFNASIDWQQGAVFLLADVANSKTYDSCVFSRGSVRIETTTNGASRVLAEKSDPRITPQNTAPLGIRVHGSNIECLWNYSSIVEANQRRGIGGIGLQAWNAQLGSASLRASEVLVRPYGA